MHCTKNLIKAILHATTVAEALNCLNIYDPKKNVNCFDSAAGLTIVAGLVGIRVFPKEQTWIQGPYPNTYWGEHSYVVFNNQVYDACSAMSLLINGLDFNHYQKLIKPRWDSEIKDLPITEIK